MVGRSPTYDILKENYVFLKIDLTGSPQPCHVRAVSRRFALKLPFFGCGLPKIHHNGLDESSNLLQCRRVTLSSHSLGGLRNEVRSWPRGPAVRAAGARRSRPKAHQLRTSFRIPPRQCDDTRSHGGIVADWNSHQVRCDGFSATRSQKMVI